MGELLNKTEGSDRISSADLRKLLGASQQEWVRLTGKNRRTVIRTENGVTRPSAEYVQLHLAMESVVRKSLRNKSRSQMKDAVSSALINELTDVFYGKEALILSLKMKLEQVQRRFQEAEQALEVLEGLSAEDLPAIKGVRMANWINVQKIRNRKKARNNGPNLQLQIELSIVAAKAIRDEAHRRLIKLGHPPTPVDQLPKKRIRSRRPIK